MPNFTIRVVLHDASRDDELALQRLMDEQGFSRTIGSSRTGTCRLPADEYDYEGAAVRTEVLKRVREAAECTGRSCSILVTESAGRTWHNLEPAS